MCNKQLMLDLLDRTRIARARNSSIVQLSQLTSKYGLSSDPVAAIPFGVVAGKQLEVMRTALLLPFISSRA